MPLRIWKVMTAVCLISGSHESMSSAAWKQPSEQWRKKKKPCSDRSDTVSSKVCQPGDLHVNWRSIYSIKADRPFATSGLAAAESQKLVEDKNKRASWELRQSANVCEDNRGGDDYHALFQHSNMVNNEKKYLTASVLVLMNFVTIGGKAQICLRFIQAIVFFHSCRVPLFCQCGVYVQWWFRTTLCSWPNANEPISFLDPSTRYVSEMRAVQVKRDLYPPQTWFAYHLVSLYVCVCVCVIVVKYIYIYIKSVTDSYLNYK